jgi:hypothetical protein
VPRPRPAGASMREVAGRRGAAQRPHPARSECETIRRGRPRGGMRAETWSRADAGCHRIVAEPSRVPWFIYRPLPPCRMRAYLLPPGHGREDERPWRPCESPLWHCDQPLLAVCRANLQSRVLVCKRCRGEVMHRRCRPLQPPVAWRPVIAIETAYPAVISRRA